MTATGSTGRRDAGVIGLVCGAHMLSHFYIVIWAPLFLFLQPEFGVSYTLLGLLVTAFAVASGAAQYLMGMLVDRIGARYVLISGLALLSTAIALMSVATEYWHLLVLATLGGLGNSVFHPADYTILGETVRPQRLGRAFSIHTFSGHVGWSLTPVVIGFLAIRFDWRVAVAAAGGIGLVMAAFLLVHRDRLAGGKAHADRAEAGRKTTTWDILGSPPILAMWVFFVMTAAIQIGMSNFLPSTLREMTGMGETGANTALTGFLVGGAAGVLAGGLIADRLRRLDLVATIGFLAAAGALVVGAAIPLTLVLSVAIFGFAGFMLGVIAPSRDLLVKSVTPDGASGKTFGFVSTGLDVGGALAGPFFGLMLDLGSPAWVFLAAAALMMVALLSGVGANLIRDRRAAPAAPAE